MVPLKRGRYATFGSLVRSNLLNVNNNSTRLLIIFLVFGMFFISGCEIYQAVYSTKVPKNETSEKAVEENVSTEELKPYIEPAVFAELNKTSKIVVIVDLRDNSGIDIPHKGVINLPPDKQKERDDSFKQRREYFDRITDEVLATMSKEEFNLTHRFTSGGFGGVWTAPLKVDR